MEGRTRRENERLVESIPELELVSLDDTKKLHIAVVVRRKSDGETAMFIRPGTTACTRSDQNHLSLLRRFARGQYTPKTERNK